MERKELNNEDELQEVEMQNTWLVAPTKREELDFSLFLSKSWDASI